MTKINTARRIQTLTVPLICVALLGACSNDMSDLNDYVADIKARQAEPIPPIPPVKTYTPYVYDGLTGRDPFRASTSEGSDDVVATENYSGPKPDRNRPREYLERFELDTLAMVGTLSFEGTDWGLVRDPDGVVHRIAVNNYIGRNHGRVTYIRESQLGLSELITDGLGGWLVREASVAIGES